MELKTYDPSSLYQFLGDNRLFLSNNEIHLTMMFVDIHDCLFSPQKDPVYTFSFLSSGTIVGVASLQQGQSAKLILSTLNEECIHLLLENITSRNFRAEVVISSPETSQFFAQKWSNESIPQIRLFQQLYYLSREMLREPSFPCRGYFSTIQNEEELEVVANFLLNPPFGKAPPLEKCREIAKQKTEDGTLVVWKVEQADGKIEIVSMAGFSNSHPLNDKYGVPRLKYVYTPPQHRGFGYASHCVYHLSKHCFDNGKKLLCLYTDKQNPTSNKIYQNIGYTFLVDHICFELPPRK